MLLLCLIRVVFVGGLATVLILKEVQSRVWDDFFSQEADWRGVTDLVINLWIFKVQILNIHDILEGVELLLLEFFSCLGMRAQIRDVVSLEILSWQIIVVEICRRALVTSMEFILRHQKVHSTPWVDGSLEFHLILRHKAGSGWDGLPWEEGTPLF